MKMSMCVFNSRYKNKLQIPWRPENTAKKQQNTDNFSENQKPENQSEHNMALTFASEIVDESANPHDWLITLKSP